MDLVFVSRNRQRLTDIGIMLQALEEPMRLTAVEGGLDRLATLPADQEPDLLLLDSQGESGGELDKIEWLNHLYPTMAVIILSETQTPEFLLRAMRAGVREVLPHPITAAALIAAVSRAAKKANGQRPRRGSILAFAGCKGGGGTTFLAANLAYVLATSEQKVLLLDLNLQFGDALLFISDARGKTTLADVAEEIDRVDASFFNSCLVSVLPNFGVLPAPEDPARALAIKPEHIDALLRLIRHHYDFIVIDAGRGLDSVSIRAMDHADLIFPVLQLTLPFVRDGKRLLETLQALGYRREKIRMIVNRYQKGGALSLEEVHAALKHECSHIVPNDFNAVAASVNQGVPITKLHPSSSVSKALHEIASTLVAHPTEASGNWFSRILKRL